MEYTRKNIFLSAGLAVVVCISVASFLILSNGDTAGGPQEVQYPELAPGEKLPDTGAGWYSRPGPEQRVFEFDGPFPKMPSKMLVYKTVRPENITEAYVRELADKYFEMPDDAEFRQNGRYYKLKTGVHILQFDSSTGFFNIFKYEKARDKLSEDRKDYPSDEECKKIATEYLKERGLLPEDAYLSGMADNISSSGAMSVWFERTIGKYKTWGPGSEILVEIGVGGEITKVAKRWLQYEPYKLAPIKTPQQAFKEVQRGKGFLAGWGKVSKISLAYHTLGADPYVQPVYYFEFTEKPGSYAAVAAVKQEYLLSREETFKYQEQKAGSSGD